MPDPGSSPGQALIRHPEADWVPASSGMTEHRTIMRRLIYRPIGTIGSEGAAISFRLQEQGILFILGLSLTNKRPSYILELTLTKDEKI